MTVAISATEVLAPEDAERLERAGYRAVVRWVRAYEGHMVVCTSAEALTHLQIEERRRKRRLLRGAP